jgi:hypothetical protein
MFVQVFRGKTSDAAGLRRQGDRWVEELAPGADGWLGSTMGVTADGVFVGLARFRDEAAARANSQRPEQGSWWNETAKYFDGEVTFADSTDIDEFRNGGSDDAGFVQVMEGRCTDKQALRDLDRSLEELEGRPDLLGGIRAWHGEKGTEFVEVAYFTSEAEAREQESAEPPAELAAVLANWQSLTGEMRYLDLSDPWMYSPG